MKAREKAGYPDRPRRTPDKELFHQMFKFDYIATAQALDTMPLTAVRGWLLSAYQFEHDEELKAQRTREGAEQMEALGV